MGNKQSQLEKNTDAIILRALDTVARGVYHQGFHIDRDDKENFLSIVKRIERRGNSLTLSVQPDYPIRVYARGPVHVGAGVGGGTGGVIGGAAGIGGGIAAGALIGSIVPVAGTIVGGVIGGIVGGIGGAVAGAGAGSGAGAATGAIVSNVDYHTVYARDVLSRLPQFTNDDKDARCTITVTG